MKDYRTDIGITLAYNVNWLRVERQFLGGGEGSIWPATRGVGGGFQRERYPGSTGSRRDTESARIRPVLDRFRDIVCDAGPTLNQYCVNIPCLTCQPDLSLPPFMPLVLSSCVRRRRQPHPMSIWCWPNVEDVGPASNRHWPPLYVIGCIFASDYFSTGSGRLGIKILSDKKSSKTTYFHSN